jgi:acyl-coenzyme A thioesterase PaaI-like protein
VNLLAPARGERLVARGRVVKAGRTLTVCQGEAAVVRDGAEHVVAVMLATMIRLDPR